MTTFAVSLPNVNTATGVYYKKALIDTIEKKYPWLKTAGLDAPEYTPSGKYIRGVEFAGPGNLITFGTAKYHDVNWVEKSEFACKRGYQPIYDLVKDYNTILNKLDVFAKERKPVYRPQYCTGCNGSNNITININVTGTPVEVFDNFIKIGYNVIPRTLTTTQLNSYSPRLVSEITYLVQTLRSL